MPEAPAATRPRRHWPELDALRGLAAALMVVNHAGFLWLGEHLQGVGAALTFAGGLAPVFFFLVTGIGRGLQPGRSTRIGPSAEVWRKVGLLCLADIALWISPDRMIGMDFLGFIALSTVVLEFVKGSSRPAWVAGGLAALVLAVRFGLAPALALGEPTHGSSPWLRFLLGDRGMIGFSYPPCPWLAYPLLGYLLGRLARHYENEIHSRRLAVGLMLAVLGGLGLGLCAALHQRGMPFFRWGSLSAAYTLFGLAASLCGLAFVIALTRLPALNRGLTLPGASSLVVVPLHYLLIHLVQAATGGIASNAVFVPAVFATTAFALVASRHVDHVLLQAGRTASGSSVTWPCLAAIALTLTAVAGIAPEGFGFPRLSWMVLAQLAVCALFPLPLPRIVPMTAAARPA